MSELYKILPQQGHQSIFQPGKKGIQWMGLEILRLEATDNWNAELAEEEAVLVSLSGCCSVSVQANEKREWQNFGNRSDIFSGSPAAVYAPRKSKLEVKAESKLELAIIKAPCDIDLLPTLITPKDVKVVSVGAANWRRDVRLIVPPGSPVSQRLIVGETFNPSGNWSGIPPHKHDVVNNVENLLEEFYLFKAKPANGFGLQMVYSNSENPVYLIGNDDIVFMSGYHPTVAAPGVTICYLWALSGKSKAYNITLDPRFDWVSPTEAILKEIRNI